VEMFIPMFHERVTNLNPCRGGTQINGRGKTSERGFPIENSLKRGVSPPNQIYNY